jgi:hypothetical protein
MRGFRILFAAVAMVLGLQNAEVLAQSAVPAGSTSVTSSNSRGDACTNVAVGTNFNTVAQQSIATTLTPPPGQSIYICAIYLKACQDATGGAVSNVNFTSTGITGNPQWGLSQASGASTCTNSDGQMNFSTPLKGQANTPVVVTSPSSATHTGFMIDVYYSQGPS